MKKLYRVEVVETFSTIYHVPAESEDDAAANWPQFPGEDYFSGGIDDVLVDLIEEDYEVPDNG